MADVKRALEEMPAADAFAGLLEACAELTREIARWSGITRGSAQILMHFAATKNERRMIADEHKMGYFSDRKAPRLQRKKGGVGKPARRNQPLGGGLRPHSQRGYGRNAHTGRR